MSQGRPLQTVRFGGVALDDVQVATARGRTLLVQAPARGHGGRLQDRGPEFREVRVAIQWISRQGLDAVARYRRLLALDDGTTRLFVHPVDGAFPAKMSIDDETIEGGNVSASVRFVEDRGDPRLERRRPGATPQQALDAAAAAATQAAARLQDAGMDLGVAEDANALVSDWRSPSVPSEVETGLSRQTAAIRSLISAKNLRANPARLPVYYSLIRLASALADAAAIVTSARERMVTMEVTGEPVTLLALAAQLYGGADARRRADQLARRNGIRDRNTIPAGTVLEVPRA